MIHQELKCYFQSLSQATSFEEEVKFSLNPPQIWLFSYKGWDAMLIRYIQFQKTLQNYCRVSITLAMLPKRNGRDTNEFICN